MDDADRRWERRQQEISQRKAARMKEKMDRRERAYRIYAEKKSWRAVGEQIGVSATRARQLGLEWRDRANSGT